MLILGNKKIRLFIGSTPTKAVYVGTEKVYPNSSLAVTESLSFEAAGGQAVLSIQVGEEQVWNLSGVPSGWSASTTTGAGPASVTITAPNNTSTAARNGTLTVVSDGLTALCSLSQAAGTQVYSVPVVSLAVADIPASGGTVSAGTVVYSQTWTWNGVAGSGGTLTSGGTVTYSAAVSAGSLETTVRARTAVGTLTATVAMNGQTGSATATVCQGANEATTITYGTPVVSLSYPDIAAGGATVTPTVSYSQSRTQHYTSGTTAALSALTSGGTLTYSGASVNTSTGAVTAASLGTTVKSRTKITTATIAVSMNGKAGTAAEDIWQAANQPMSYKYRVVCLNDTSSRIPYGGGSVTVSAKSQRAATYTSGAIGGYEDTTAQSITARISGTGFSIVPQSNTVATYYFTVTATAHSSSSTREGTVTFTGSIGGSDTFLVTQTGITISYDFRYSYSNKASKYPRFAVNGVPGGELLRAIGGMGTPIHMLSYREAIKKVQGSTTSYLNGEPTMAYTGDAGAYVGAGYNAGWNDSYALGFISMQQGNFMNNYPYKYVTESFRVTGSDFTLSGIALFEKNYGDYEAAGYKWYVEADTSSPYALSADEARAVQQLTENRVVTTEDDPELASADFEALAAKINALRQPDTDTYVQNEDGTWTIVSQENENTTL